MDTEKPLDVKLILLNPLSEVYHINLSTDNYLHNTDRSV